jgi:hypothetical protein
MAYSVSNAGSGVDKTFDNSFITRNELYAILDQLKEETEFYELEIFEVVESSSTDNDLLPGQVRGRYVISEQGDSLEEVSDRVFLPLNPNIIQYPLRGELCVGMSYKGQQYYLGRLSENVNDINFKKFNESTLTENQTDDFTQGNYFKDLKPTGVNVNEGDTLIQGRFGNSINLTSAQNIGIEDSSTITINNRNSIIDLQSTSNSELININSNLISINAEQDIFAFAENNVNISGSFLNVDTTDIFIDKNNIKLNSSEQVKINSSKIDIGSDSLVPAVLGNKDLIKAIDAILSMMISANQTEIGAQLARPVPNTIKIAELTEENVELNKIKSGKTYLSKKVNVE